MTAGGTSSLLMLTRLFAARQHFASNQRIEILSRFDAVNIVQDRSRLRAHFAADLFVVFFGKLAALVLEVKVLDISQNDFLFPLQKVPLGFFNDGGFESVVLAEQWPANRRQDGGH